MSCCRTFRFWKDWWRKIEGGYDILVNVEPFGVVRVKYVPGESIDKENIFGVKEKTLDTLFYNIEWNENGQFTKSTIKKLE